MHKIAEYGVAAHWNYKDPASDKNVRKFGWIQELVGILDEEAGAEEFLEHTKWICITIRFFALPRVVTLLPCPKGATAVDFAYAVHSKVGQKCCGVRINGKNRQLATELENGDQIDIITKATAHPLAEWENFVKTGRAKSGIRRAVRAERAVEFSRVGKSILQKAFVEVNKPLKNGPWTRFQRFLAQKPEDLFALVGEGRMQPELVIEKMFPDLAKSKKRVRPTGETNRDRAKSGTPMLKIQGGNSGIAITMARCCHPLPGEDIVGIFTTGKGVTVHRADCGTSLISVICLNYGWMSVGNMKGQSVSWGG